MNNLSKTDFRGLTGFVLLSFAALFLTSCSQEQGEQASDSAHELIIAVSKTPLSAPIYIAEELGYFKSQGLKVRLDEYVGGNRCLNAMLEDKAALATTSDYPIMINSFKRKDFTVLATFVSSENDVKLMTRKSLGIQFPAQLKGKTIGVVKGASSHYFLDRFLLFNDINLSDVKVVHVSPENMPLALQSGKVDAVSVWEPFGYLSSNLLKDDLVIFPGENYYRETFNLASKNKTATTEHGNIKRLLRALGHAIAFIKEYPDKAQQILLQRLNQDSDFIEWIWNDYNFNLTLDQTLLLTLEHESRWAMENGIVSAEIIPNFLDYISPEALGEINSRAVTIIQ